VSQGTIRRVALQVFRHLHDMDLTFHLSRQTGGQAPERRGLGGWWACCGLVGLLQGQLSATDTTKLWPVGHAV
jgi:hypothetical protein